MFSTSIFCTGNNNSLIIEMTLHYISHFSTFGCLPSL